MGRKKLLEDYEECNVPGKNSCELGKVMFFIFVIYILKLFFKKIIGSIWVCKVSER